MRDPRWLAERGGREGGRERGDGWRAERDRLGRVYVSYVCYVGRWMDG